MPEQPSEPLGILRIGLPARHVLHMLGVGYDQHEQPLQHFVDRLPVLARRLHRHVRHFHLQQPVPHRLEIIVKSGELHQRLDHLSPFGRHHANRHRILVHIDPCSSINQNLHVASSKKCLEDACTEGCVDSAARACAGAEQQIVVPLYGAGQPVVRGFKPPQRNRSLRVFKQRQRYTVWPALFNPSLVNGGPQPPVRPVVNFRVSWRSYLPQRHRGTEAQRGTESISPADARLVAAPSTRRPRRKRRPPRIRRSRG